MAAGGGAGPRGTDLIFIAFVFALAALWPSSWPPARSIRRTASPGRSASWCPARLRAFFILMLAAICQGDERKHVRGRPRLAGDGRARAAGRAPGIPLRGHDQAPQVAVRHLDLPPSPPGAGQRADLGHVGPAARPTSRSPTGTSRRSCARLSCSSSTGACRSGCSPSRSPTAWRVLVDKLHLAAKWQLVLRSTWGRDPAVHGVATSSRSSSWADDADVPVSSARPGSSTTTDRAAMAATSRSWPPDPALRRRALRRGEHRQSQARDILLVTGSVNERTSRSSRTLPARCPTRRSSSPVEPAPVPAASSPAP